ncbi:hypothetical protein [Streptomyces sp. NPDC059918]|uniref:hypothetical protein n=1 Tax=unclassified Streptomyces TaxID=2593676 RepID=UPI00364FB5A7
MTEIAAFSQTFTGINAAGNLLLPVRAGFNVTVALPGAEKFGEICQGMTALKSTLASCTFTVTYVKKQGLLATGRVREFAIRRVRKSERLVLPLVFTVGFSHVVMVSHEVASKLERLRTVRGKAKQELLLMAADEDAGIEVDAERRGRLLREVAALGPAIDRARRHTGEVLLVNGVGVTIGEGLKDANGEGVDVRVGVAAEFVPDGPASRRLRIGIALTLKGSKLSKGKETSCALVVPVEFKAGEGVLRGAMRGAGQGSEDHIAELGDISLPRGQRGLVGEMLREERRRDGTADPLERQSPMLSKERHRQKKARKRAVLEGWSAPDATVPDAEHGTGNGSLLGRAREQHENWQEHPERKGKQERRVRLEAGEQWGRIMHEIERIEADAETRGDTAKEPQGPGGGGERKRGKGFVRSRTDGGRPPVSSGSVVSGDRRGRLRATDPDADTDAGDSSEEFVPRKWTQQEREAFARAAAKRRARKGDGDPAPRARRTRGEPGTGTDTAGRGDAERGRDPGPGGTRGAQPGEPGGPGEPRGMTGLAEESEETEDLT